MHPLVLNHGLAGSSGGDNVGDHPYNKFDCCQINKEFSTSSSTVRLREINGNLVNGNHLEICLLSLSFRENGNSLTWVLVALTVCFIYPVLYRVSEESQAGEWGL